jgi:hypothetical protein
VSFIAFSCASCGVHDTYAMLHAAAAAVAVVAAHRLTDYSRQQLTTDLHNSPALRSLSQAGLDDGCTVERAHHTRAI